MQQARTAPRAPVFGRSGHYGCAWRDAQQILLRAAVCDAGCYFVFVGSAGSKMRPARFSESSERRLEVPEAYERRRYRLNRLRKTICLYPGPDSQPQASQFTASKLHAYAVSSSAANAADSKLSALGVAQLARRKFAAARANAATLPKADPHVPARAMPLAPPRAVPRRASPSRPRRHTI